MARNAVFGREDITFAGLQIHVLYKMNKYMRLHVQRAPRAGVLESKPTKQDSRQALWQEVQAKSPQPSIILTAPLGTQMEAIESFLTAQEAWLHRACAQVQRATEASENLLQDKDDKVLLFGEWVPALPLRVLKQELESYLIPRTKELAESMGLSYSSLAVRPSRSRFGSCSKDRLSFSILLAFAHREEIDYVIIHELAHIVHKDHSARFWGLVEAHCPSWRTLRRALRSRYGVYSALLDRLASR